MVLKPILSLKCNLGGRLENEHISGQMTKQFFFPKLKVNYPTPSVDGTFKAFGSIMFAFAGASTFPTIQADMKHKDQFPTSVKAACVSK